MHHRRGSAVIRNDRGRLDVVINRRDSAASTRKGKEHHDDQGDEDELYGTLVPPVPTELIFCFVDVRDMFLFAHSYHHTGWQYELALSRNHDNFHDNEHVWPAGSLELFENSFRDAQTVDRSTHDPPAVACSFTHRIEILQGL